MGDLGSPAEGAQYSQGLPQVKRRFEGAPGPAETAVLRPKWARADYRLSFRKATNCSTKAATATPKVTIATTPCIGDPPTKAHPPSKLETKFGERKADGSRACPPDTRNAAGRQVTSGARSAGK